ncbi:MAG: desulfoferrodoxin [Deltaproteobacteria bacterium]|jgi:superoxide reductase|nr:desulfoferrodoxin [Deltaproteobacteria bacterium]
MAQINQVYKCSLCQQMVTVVGPGAGVLTCCGQPMKEVKENSTEAAKEKHIPVVAKVPGGYKVTVGSVAHPMEEKHFIEWIEFSSAGAVQRHHLKPGETPEHTFASTDDAANARAYCNLHGLWRS